MSHWKQVATYVPAHTRHYLRRIDKLMAGE
ncbi:hypothetical protein CCP4SC76_60001 [Gammaproteobacteria bacterium]